MICSACGNNVEYFRACRCPPIIVTGCGHSGTTIVARKLAYNDPLWRWRGYDTSLTE